MAIDPALKTLIDDKNFGALTTLMPGGMPQTQVMWVDADDEHVLINTEVGRQKYRNVARDPRVAITVWNCDNPYQYVEVRGRVVDTVTGDEARAHIDALSRKYTGGDYANPIGTERVIVKIAPERIHTNGV
jgi:PPOX class probable F420-dependent enzyme